MARGWLAATGFGIAAALSTVTVPSGSGETLAVALDTLGVRATARATLASEPEPGPTVLEPVTITRFAEVFVGVSDAELRRLSLEDPLSLGTASIGRPNRGALFNGVQIPEKPFWEVKAPYRTFATPRVIESLEIAVRHVAERFPNTPKIGVSDASREHGGYSRPHRSHQSGLDVDLGYYYLGGYAFFVPANETNLDVPRTWALIRALLAGGNVDYVFVDESIRVLLKEQAVREGEPPGYLEWVFGNKPITRGVIRHTWGHDDHIHVRFFDEEAAARGRRLAPVLQRYRRYR